MPLSHASIAGIALGTLALVLSALSATVYLSRLRRQRSHTAAARTTTEPTNANADDMDTSRSDVVHLHERIGNGAKSHEHEGYPLELAPPPPPQTTTTMEGTETVPDAASSEARDLTGTKNPLPAMDAAARIVGAAPLGPADMAPRSGIASRERPSSLHQAVLEVGGRAKRATEAAFGVRQDEERETKTEDPSAAATTEARTRPTAYTGAWP